MSRPRVFAIGSFRDGCKGTAEQFQQAAKLLGKALADHACDLVLNSESPRTVDPWIFEGYCKGSKPKQVTIHRPDAKHAVGESSRPYASTTDKRVSLSYPKSGGTFRTSHLRSIAYSDIVLAIGGSAKGTLNAVSAAEVLLKPVAGVVAFGGATEEAAPDYQHYYNDSIRRQLVSTLDDLTETWANQFVKGLIELSNSNPVARSRATLHPLAALAVFVASVFVWIAGYTNTWDLLEQYSLPTVGAMLVATCSFVVVLQRVAMAIGLPVPSKNPGSPILEWLVALGVAVLLLFITLAAGNLIANKTLEPLDLADLQKTALTVTALAVTSTLATEASWKKIRDWATSRTN